MGVYNNKTIRNLKNSEFYCGKIEGIYSSNTLISSLQDGDKYLVGNNATDLFIGRENCIAIYNLDGKKEKAPGKGLRQWYLIP